MTRWLRSRTGIFPGITPEPVEVLDVIVDGYVVGSFYKLATDHWEFLGPWDHQNRIRVDGTVDRLMRDKRTFWLYTDGTSRENGARAAIGAVLYDSNYRRLVVRADSLLVVNQVRGRFKVKKAELKLLHAKACDLLGRLQSHYVEHVPRKYNRRADALAEEAFSR